MVLKQRARKMRLRELRVDSLLKPLSPHFQDAQCTVETDRSLVQQQIIKQASTVLSISSTNASPTFWQEMLAGMTTSLPSQAHFSS